MFIRILRYLSSVLYIKDRAAETELGLLFCQEMELYSPEFQVDSRYVQYQSKVSGQSLKTWASILNTRFSKSSRLKIQVLSQDFQLTFDW